MSKVLFCSSSACYVDLYYQVSCFSLIGFNDIWSLSVHHNLIIKTLFVNKGLILSLLFMLKIENFLSFDLVLSACMLYCWTNVSPTFSIKFYIKSKWSPVIIMMSTLLLISSLTNKLIYHIYIDCFICYIIFILNYFILVHLKKDLRNIKSRWNINL